MTRNHLGGDYVRLCDARYAMNAMQSVIASTECAGLPQAHALVKHHKERGDMLRIWAIIGDPNSGGKMKQDVFQRLGEIMETLHAQKLELARLRDQASRVEGVVKDEEPRRITGPDAGWDDA